MLNEVKRRALAPTPPLFQKIRNWALLATMVGGAVSALPTFGVTIPVWLASTCAFISYVAPIIAGKAQLTEVK